jgi:tRNA threonylcarbamoyladenosine modification (KEOPS) complex  Pcc1 subunit
LEPRQNQAEAKILIEALPKVVEVIISSLKPELESGISERSRVFLEPSEKGLVIRISADDITALRAAVNSYLYWIQSIMDIGNRVHT